MRAIPRVNDLHVCSTRRSAERPLDVHAFRYTADVPETDRRRTFVDRHFRQPPRRPPKRAERPVSRHLDYAAPVSRALAKLDITVMGQVRRPFFHLLCEA